MNTETWREVCQTIKLIRTPLVRVTARAPRTPHEAVRRIRCLDTAYVVRDRLDRLVREHIDLRCMQRAQMRQMYGLCGVAAHGLCMALAAIDIEAVPIEGRYGSDEAHRGHCWVRVPGTFEVLDVTASQFMSPRKAPARVVARQRPGGRYWPERTGVEFYREAARWKRRAGVCPELMPKAWDHLRWWERGP